MGSFLEQGTGVEPAFTAWEAVVLPIYEPCKCSCAVAIPPALQSKATSLYTREAMRVDRHIAQFIITKSFGESKCFLTLGIYRGRWIFALFTFLEMCGIMFGILRRFGKPKVLSSAGA